MTRTNLTLRTAALALIIATSGLASAAYAESSLGGQGATYPQTQAGTVQTVQTPSAPSAPSGSLGIN